LDSQKKWKASIGDPAPAQQKSRKEAQKPLPAEIGSDKEAMRVESASRSQSSKRPKAKGKVVKAPQNLVSEGEKSGEEGDLGTTGRGTSKRSKGKKKASETLPSSSSDEGGPSNTNK